MRLLNTATILLFSLLAASGQTIVPCKPKANTKPVDFGSTGPVAVSRQIVLNPDSNAPLPISIFMPATASTTNRVPVVFFSHGFNAVDYHYYEGLLRQLASNGYAAVYVPYSSTGTNASRYSQLWAGFQMAVQQNSNIVDTSRVGFAGHSYGGGATPEMARLAANHGWGRNGLFIFTMAAWYSWGTNYEEIPANTKLVVQIYWDDTANDHVISQNDIWNRLPQINERKWQVIRASSAVCTLAVPHIVPVSGLDDGNLDALDLWGVWRRLHALAAYTFSGNTSAKETAFGTDSNMGRFRSAPKSVTPMQAVDFPVTNPNAGAFWTWAMRCSVADPGVPCP